MTNEYSVVQFFDNDTYEYVSRFVEAKEAVETAARCARSVGAQTGVVTRVIITDGGDHTNFEWKFGKGITFPENWATKAAIMGDDA